MRVKKSELKRVIREEAYRLEYSEYKNNLEKLNRMVNEAILSEFMVAGLVSQNSGFKLLREGTDLELSTAIVPILRECALNEQIDWGALAKKTGGLAARVGKGALKLGGRAVKKGAELAYAGAKKAAPHIGRGIKQGAKFAGRTAVQGYKGARSLTMKAMQGSELMRMAKMDPKAFLELHRETETMIKGLSPDIRDARSAESFLGLLQTDAGMAMMDDIISRTGMSSAEVERLIDNYVHQSEFVQTAVNSMESSRMQRPSMSPSPA